MKKEIWLEGACADCGSKVYATGVPDGMPVDHCCDYLVQCLNQDCPNHERPQICGDMETGDIGWLV
jgi:hypothetical protein